MLGQERSTNVLSLPIRQEGLEYEVLQWYICRMEAWFAADVDTISLKNWDQVIIFRNGYHLQKVVPSA